MGNLIEKLDTYKVLNYLLPGVFFCLMLRFMFGITFPTNSAFEDIIVYYFVGLIIGRIGSLVIQKPLEKLRIIKNAPYSDYVQAMRSDLKIDTLSEANNYFRSLLTCSILLLIIWLLYFFNTQQICLWVSANWQGFAVAFLVILFLFAYRKQTEFIRKRVEKVNEMKDE